MSDGTKETEPTWVGSPAAVRMGCTCDPTKNNYGYGELIGAGPKRRVTIAVGCPVHSAFKVLRDDT